jgi:TPR repeat protein
LGASQGDAHAQNNLGTMFLRGAGCLVDEAKAVSWYRRAAEQGHLTAQANLAKRHLRGEGVAPDLAEAFRWFHAASQQGDLASTWELGTMYRFGRGVERNIVLAADLHLTVAKAGVVMGQVSLGDCLDELQGLALSGDPAASRLLCEMHNLGLGAEASEPLTWTWIKWAKEQCKPADDPGDAAEVGEAYDFYEQWLSDEARAEGERVLAALLRPFPRALRAAIPRVRSSGAGAATGVGVPDSSATSTASTTGWSRCCARSATRRRCAPGATPIAPRSSSAISSTAGRSRSRPSSSCAR